MTLDPKKITPLYNNVLIQPLDPEDVTASGILLPDSAKEKPQVGLVAAVGPGKMNEDGDQLIPTQVKVNQKVLYKKWSGTEVKVGREEWTILEDKDILAIVE